MRANTRFMLAATTIITSNTGDSTRDMFKTAVQLYEDSFGEIIDAKADEFYKIFLDTLSKIEETA
jgi:hypothetical protein|tara:strand:+ start:43 stop:237 length:195 start_codon:yes stop_codon:yes gene_type:complete